MCSERRLNRIGWMTLARCTNIKQHDSITNQTFKTYFTNNLKQTCIITTLEVKITIIIRQILPFFLYYFLTRVVRFKILTVLAPSQNAFSSDFHPPAKLPSQLGTKLQSQIETVLPLAGFLGSCAGPMTPTPQRKLP